MFRDTQFEAVEDAEERARAARARESAPVTHVDFSTGDEVRTMHVREQSPAPVSRPSKTLSRSAVCPGVKLSTSEEVLLDGMPAKGIPAREAVLRARRPARDHGGR